jgi:hypothetical protein
MKLLLDLLNARVPCSSSSCKHCITKHCKAPIQYSEVYLQEVRETFRDPLPDEDFISYTLEPKTEYSRREEAAFEPT